MQVLNQETAGGEAPPKIPPPLEKCVGHSSKLLDIVYKICPDGIVFFEQK